MNSKLERYTIKVFAFSRLKRFQPWLRLFMQETFWKMLIVTDGLVLRARLVL